MKKTGQTATTCLAHPSNRPIIQKFEELRQAAKVRGAEHLKRSYTRILASLRSYPLPLTNSVEANKLEGIGKSSAAIVDQLPLDKDVTNESPEAAEARARALRQFMVNFHEKVILKGREVRETYDSDFSASSAAQPPSSTAARPLRLLPGSSAWSILLVIFLSRSRTPAGLSAAAIKDAAEAASALESRIKIVNIRAVDRLVEFGLVEAIEQVNGTIDSVAAAAGTLKKKKNNSNAFYRITESGCEEAQKILCKIDTPTLMLEDRANRAALTPGTVKSTVPSALQTPVLPTIREEKEVPPFRHFAPEEFSYNTPPNRGRRSLTEQIDILALQYHKDANCEFIPACEEFVESGDDQQDEQRDDQQDEQQDQQQDQQRDQQRDVVAEPEESLARNDDDRSNEAEVEERQCVKGLREKLAQFQNDGQQDEQSELPTESDGRGAGHECDDFIRAFKLASSQTQVEVGPQAEPRAEPRAEPLARPLARPLVRPSAEPPAEAHLPPQIKDDFSQDQLPPLTSNTVKKEERTGTTPLVSRGATPVNPHVRLKRNDTEWTLEDDDSCATWTAAEEEVLLSLLEAASELRPEHFSVRLIVDFREAEILNLLKENDDFFRQRNLPEGDFLWVVEIRKPANVFTSSVVKALIAESGAAPSRGPDMTVDFVLPYLVERKTYADLAASVIDGRYEDQKFRMLRSPGTEHAILLLEGSSGGSSVTTAGALASLLVVSGITVVYANSSSDTAEWLCGMTAALRSRFSQQTAGMTGEQMLHGLMARHPLFLLWARRSRRLTTVFDVFGRQLRMIDKVGDKTVETLLSLFPTPAALAVYLQKVLSDQQVVAELKQQAARLAGPELRSRAPASLAVVAVLRELFSPASVAASRRVAVEEELLLREGKKRKRRKKAKAEEPAAPANFQTT